MTTSSTIDLDHIEMWVILAISLPLIPVLSALYKCHDMAMFATVLLKSHLNANTYSLLKL